MPTNTYTALATITLGGSDSEILFSSIPNTYRDLVLVCAARTNNSATSEPVRLRFNSDSTNGNYARVSMHGSGSGSGDSYADAPGEIIIDMGAAGSYLGSTTYSILNIQIFDYAQGNKHKGVLTTSELAQVQVRRQAGRWASNTAINTISLTPYFGYNFQSGSTFSLYGIVS